MSFRWRYPNLVLLFCGLLLAVIVLRYGQTDLLTEAFGRLGYGGVFVAGLFFVSTFTVAPAAAVLFEFAQNLTPLLVALFGGLGAAVGDYIAYRFIREKIFAELNPILKTLHLYRQVDLLHSKYFTWLAPVIGLAIIASPLPDELGLTLLGLKKIKPASFLLMTFIFNAIGIYLIALAAYI